MTEQAGEDKMEMKELTRQYNEKQEREREAAKTDQEKNESMDADKQINNFAKTI